MAANPNNFGCSFYCYVKMLIGKILLSCIKRKLKSSKIGIIAGKQKDFNWWLDSPNPHKISLARGPVAGWAGMTLSRSPQYRTMLPQRETHLSSPLAVVVTGARSGSAEEQQHRTIAAAHTDPTLFGAFSCFNVSTDIPQTYNYRSPLQETILYTKPLTSIVIVTVNHKIHLKIFLKHIWEK